MSATQVGLYRSPDRSQVWITTDSDRTENAATHVSIGACRWLVRTNEVQRSNGDIETVHRLICQTGRTGERIVESSNRELIASVLDQIMQLAPGAGCIIESLDDEGAGRIRIMTGAPASAVLCISTRDRGTVEHTTY